MMRLLLVILASCAAVEVYDGVPVNPASHMAFDVVTLEGDQHIKITLVTRGHAAHLGGNLYVAPRHVIGAGPCWLRTRDAVFQVEELASGTPAYRPTTFDDVLDDWVIFRTDPGVPDVARSVSVSGGDFATLLPSGERCRVTEVFDECLIIERGPLEPGWSGTPVAVHGHVIGFVHGMYGDMYGDGVIIIPLPLRPLAQALHTAGAQERR